MNVVDLFAGCGGLSYGFKMANFNIVLGIDNNIDCANTYILNHPGSKYIVKDIRDIEKTEIFKELNDKRIDVIIGGPPCQGFSLSGKRVLLDPRNTLYLDYFRILDMLQPQVALIENVPGLASLYNGKALKEIKNLFQKRGYAIQHRVLFASEYGVPQIRKRIFIVATKKANFEFPLPKKKTITLGDALGDMPNLERGDISTEYRCKPQNTYQKLMRGSNKLLFNNDITKHKEKTKYIISLVPEGKDYRCLPTHLKNTRKVNIAWTRLDSKKPSLTIDTGHRHYFHPWENRVPTVRESARIQSFPDSFIFTGSKTSQYRQVGNAVPPLLAYELAMNIKGALDE